MTILYRTIDDNFDPDHCDLTIDTCIRDVYAVAGIDINIEIDDEIDDYYILRNHALRLAIKTTIRSDSELTRILVNLYHQMPYGTMSRSVKKQWWQEQRPAWMEQLHRIMIEHRNIGHDWQLRKAQTQRLHQYYEAHHLLVACLNSDFVSRAVREEIEDTLLLPLAEIERRSTV
jgi:hypothetical protein